MSRSRESPPFERSLPTLPQRSRACHYLRSADSERSRGLLRPLLDGSRNPVGAHARHHRARRLLLLTCDSKGRSRGVTFVTENVGSENHELAFLPGGGEVPFKDAGEPDEDACCRRSLRAGGLRSRDELQRYLRPRPWDLHLVLHRRQP